jgi:hypothetical protein
MIAFDKVQRIGEEAVLVDFKAFSDIILDGINKITRNLQQDSWCLNRCLILECPERRLSQLAP